MSDDKVVLRWIQKLAYLDSLKSLIKQHPEALIISPELNQSRLVLPAARRTFRRKAMQPFIHPIPGSAGSWLNEIAGFQYYLLDSPGYVTVHPLKSDGWLLRIDEWKISLMVDMGQNEFLFRLREVADEGRAVIGGYDILHSKYYILFTQTEVSTNDSDSRED